MLKHWIDHGPTIKSYNNNNNNNNNNIQCWKARLTSSKVFQMQTYLLLHFHCTQFSHGGSLEKLGLIRKFSSLSEMTLQKANKRERNLHWWSWCSFLGVMDSKPCDTESEAWLFSKTLENSFTADPFSSYKLRPNKLAKLKSWKAGVKRFGFSWLLSPLLDP